MFDRHYHQSSPSHTSITKTVHEHRAPTDESVRLLNEMEARARANLVASFATSNNILQAKWAEYRDPISGDHQFFCKMVLNGKSHDIRLKIDEFTTTTAEDKVQALYARLCEMLAADLMRPLLQEMRNKL